MRSLNLILTLLLLIPIPILALPFGNPPVASLDPKNFANTADEAAFINPFSAPEFAPASPPFKADAARPLLADLPKPPPEIKPSVLQRLKNSWKKIGVRSARQTQRLLNSILRASKRRSAKQREGLVKKEAKFRATQEKRRTKFEKDMKVLREKTERRIAGEPSILEVAWQKMTSGTREATARVVFQAQKEARRKIFERKQAKRRAKIDESEKQMEDWIAAASQKIGSAKKGPPSPETPLATTPEAE